MNRQVVHGRRLLPARALAAARRMLRRFNELRQAQAERDIARLRQAMGLDDLPEERHTENARRSELR